MENPILGKQQMTLADFYNRIYALVGVGILVSAATAFITLTFFANTIMTMLQQGGFTLLILSLVPLLVVFPLSRAASNNSPMALPLFIGFSALFGFILSFTLAFYTAGDITIAFVTASAMFFGLSIYGRLTKRNLSAMGKVLGTAVWGLIIAMVLNFFFHSSMITLLTSLAGVVIFSGLIAWDNQKIAHVYNENNGNVKEGWAISMALSLYLDFINLFLFLLRLFGIAGSNNRN